MKTVSASALLLAGCLSLTSLKAQDNRATKQNYLVKPEETEYWDPEVRVITPGGAVGAAPSDAIVLFDGKNLDNWVTVKDGSPVKWELKDGAFSVVKGAGNISTKQDFGDYQLHLEWRSPNEPETLKSQGKGNSGVFMQGMYEVQIMNSYQNRTYRNGQAGSIYKQTAPLVNPSAKMSDWNVYDIFYTAPRFTQNGGVETPAYLTLVFNGVLVQNHTKIQGTTPYIGAPQNPVHGKGPISLQDHGNAVSYRNIWIREL